MFVCLLFGFYFGWVMVAIVLVMIVIYAWFSFFFSEKRIAIRREYIEADMDASTKAIDSLLNYETVKYFGNERWEAGRFDRSMERFERASIRTYSSLAILNSGQAFIFTVGMVLAMIFAARGIAQGTMTVGDFVLVNAVFIQLYQPLNFMGMIYRELKQALVDIEAMFTLLGQKPEVKDKPGAKPLIVSKGAIRFENVFFSYDDARPILRGVDFEVPPGHMVALVGPSGAGKSTMSRLLYRFYDVKSGRILIDGQDIRDVTQESLRAAIGIVPQDTVLFNDTIEYNIRYGHVTATDEEVKEAARLAQIDGFIQQLPLGYKSLVGERGLKLSGGEKQRVAIARTILKAPPILMLDEATSALDSFTEKEIQASLDQVAKNRTTLVIAHRLSTVIHCRHDPRHGQGKDCRARHACRALGAGRPLCRALGAAARGGGSAPQARGDGRGRRAHRGRHKTGSRPSPVTSARSVEFCRCRQPQRKAAKLLRAVSSRNEIGDLIRNVRRQGTRLGICRGVGSHIRGFHHFKEMIGFRQDDELRRGRRLF